VVEKLFREHYAEKQFAATTGTFRDLPNRRVFFDDISQMKPEKWKPGTVDAIATGSADGRRVVIKAVNYDAQPNTLLVRLQGSGAPERGTVRAWTVSASLTDAASLEHPDKIRPVESSLPFLRDLTIELQPHTVIVVEIRAE
jgi:alpha-N-arabinofuranosidase